MRMIIVAFMDISDNQHGDPTPWCAVHPDDCTVLSKARARSWALVLDARSIPCCIEPAEDGWQVLVREHQLESARRELQLYEEANRGWPPAATDSRQALESTLPTIAMLLLLATFHNLSIVGLSLPGHGTIDLHELGTAHAASIRNGQWWQCITALTLHAGPVHLLSNLTIGGTVIILLCNELGSGLAWILLLASGTLGNFINAWVQLPEHRSVGASTAVFGAVGILAAISLVRGGRHPHRRWFIPVAAGLALLAILGTEGKQTDLGAHFFGFAAGTVFGLATEFLRGRYGQPGGVLNFLMAVLSAMLVVAAWWLTISV